MVFSKSRFTSPAVFVALVFSIGCTCISSQSHCQESSRQESSGQETSGQETSGQDGLKFKTELLHQAIECLQTIKDSDEYHTAIREVFLAAAAIGNEDIVDKLLAENDELAGSYLLHASERAAVFEHHELSLKLFDLSCEIEKYYYTLCVAFQLSKISASMQTDGEMFFENLMRRVEDFEEFEFEAYFKTSYPSSSDVINFDNLEKNNMLNQMRFARAIGLIDNGKFDSADAFIDTIDNQELKEVIGLALIKALPTDAETPSGLRFETEIGIDRYAKLRIIRLVEQTRLAEAIDLIDKLDDKNFAIRVLCKIAKDDSDQSNDNQKQRRIAASRMFNLYRLESVGLRNMGWENFKSKRTEMAFVRDAWISVCRLHEPFVDEYLLLDVLIHHQLTQTGAELLAGIDDEMKQVNFGRAIVRQTIKAGAWNSVERFVQETESANAIRLYDDDQQLWFELMCASARQKNYTAATEFLDRIENSETSGQRLIEFLDLGQSSHRKDLAKFALAAIQMQNGDEQMAKPTIHRFEQLFRDEYDKLAEDYSKDHDALDFLVTEVELIESFLGDEISVNPIEQEIQRRFAEFEDSDEVYDAIELIEIRFVTPPDSPQALEPGAGQWFQRTLEILKRRDATRYANRDELTNLVRETKAAIEFRRSRKSKYNYFSNKLPLVTTLLNQLKDSVDREKYASEFAYLAAKVGDENAVGFLTRKIDDPGWRASVLADCAVLFPPTMPCLEDKHGLQRFEPRPGGIF